MTAARRPAALPLFLALVVAALGSVHPAQGKRTPPRPPTQLWKLYPLNPERAHSRPAETPPRTKTRPRTQKPPTPEAGDRPRTRPTKVRPAESLQRALSPLLVTAAKGPLETGATRIAPAPSGDDGVAWPYLATIGILGAAIVVAAAGLLRLRSSSAGRTGSTARVRRRVHLPSLPSRRSTGGLLPLRRRRGRSRREPAKTDVVPPSPARIAEPLRPAGVEGPPRLEPAPPPVEPLTPASREPASAPVEQAKPVGREPAPAPVERAKPAGREPAPAPVEPAKPASREPAPAPVEPLKPASREPAPPPVEPLKPASRKPAPAPVEERAEPPRAEPPRALETCEIAFWRGYAKGQFYAAGVAPGVKRAYAVAVSPSFRVRRGEGVPETQTAVAALDTLIKTLLEAGWTPQGRGDKWYVRRFARRSSGRRAAAPAASRTASPT
jgi:hypothetical protein